MPKRKRDLEIAQDIGFERVEWAIERVMWGAMALLVVAAVLGLLGGGGVLSGATVEESGTTISYERYLRWQRKTTITVRRDPPLGENVRIGVEHGFLSGMEVVSVTPEPDGSWTSGGWAFYEFSANPGDVEGLVVAFTMRPLRIGGTIGAMRVDDGPPIELRPFVYP